MDLFERIRERAFHGVGFITGPIELRGREDDGKHAVSIAFRAQSSLEDLALKFEKEAKTIEADTNLTKKGQREKLQRLGTDILVKIGKQRELLLKPVTDALNAMQNKRDGKPASKTYEQKTLETLVNLIDTLNGIEVRRMLLELPDKQRTALVSNIASSGDELLYKAVTQAPHFIRETLTGLDEEAWLELEEQWLAKKDPELHAELTEVRDAQEILSHNFEELTRAIIHRFSMREAAPAAIVKGSDGLGNQTKTSISFDGDGKPVITEIE
jgi:hypothetical protein